MCRRIGELEIMPTRMTLQPADRSITRPYGVVEDVLVKVQQFTFPVDFVIMDIEEDDEIPLILGRPFMLTANCVVDIGKGNLEMGIDDQKITFDLFDAEKNLLDRNVCSKIDEVENEMVLMARAKIAPDPWGNMRQASDVKEVLIRRQPVATCPFVGVWGEVYGCAFQRRKNARSRTQRLFVENVGKTEGNQSK